MKTKYLMLAMTAVLVASCSQNDVMMDGAPSDRSIGFKVYTGVQARGAVTDTPEIQKKNNGFGVFAYLTNGEYATATSKSLYMDNVRVSYDGTSNWEYSPLKYWPTNGTDKVSFFAYAPYNANGLTITANATTPPSKLRLELPEKNQKDMVDLVVSEASDGADKTSGKVTFNLKHVLTRVGLKAKTSLDISNNGQTKVFITGVTLVNTTKLYKEGTLDMATSKWESLTAFGKDYPLQPVKSDDATIKGILNLTAANFAGYTKQSIDITANQDGVSLFPQNEYLFLLPLSGSSESGSSKGDIKVKIDYDIVTMPSYGATTHAVSSKTEEISMPASSFKQGTAYMFVFNITMAGIEVSASVADWTTDTDSTIPVPETTAP